MAERTSSWWRRIVSWPPSPQAAAHPLPAERRMWVRYRSTAHTSCQPISAAGPKLWLARVQNICRGGINLLVNRRFEKGALLSIELPGPAGQAPCSVLACVIHVRDKDEGEWALGCNFAGELSDELLERLGANKVKAPPPDQRQWVRFPCEVEAVCRVADDEIETWPAQVVDVCVNGMGLILGQHLDVGALLHVRLPGVAGQASYNMLACVVHVRAQGDEWFLGCTLIRELTEEELRSLL